jgi:phosphomannomutase/phosphoglucomutase
MIKDKIATPDAQKVVKRLEQKFPHDRIDLTDGVKITRNSTSALIRASGTEPIIRIIVESDQRDHAESLFQELMKCVLECLKTTTKQKKR